MKTKHNLFKNYKRGIQKILEECLFSALALNLKRMIKVVNWYQKDGEKEY